MKNNRVIITILLIVFVCIGWASQIGNNVEASKKYDKFVEAGKEYFSDGLYQKSIEAYTNALAIKNDVKILEKLVEAYKLSYLEGTSTLIEYSTALKLLCELDISEPDNWRDLIQLYIDNGDYKSAYSIINKCPQATKDNKKLAELIQDVTYSYTVSKKSFVDYFRAPEGYYTVFDGKNWGVLSKNGEWLYECEYAYISPINQNLDVLLVTSSDSRIFDAKGIVQAKFEEAYSMTNAYNGGLLPVQDSNGEWRYYSCDEKKYLRGSFEYATSFYGEKALIKEKGVWRYIDINGEKNMEMTFDDVKLYGNGAYSYMDVMIASTDDKYFVFTCDGEKKIDVWFIDMDVYLGEAIAFKDSSGKWGFIDIEGNIIIDPHFDEAKSFSNGFAAVKKGDEWGFINKEGQLVIDYQFLDADYFTEDGICLVSTFEQQYYMIDLRFY